MADRKEFEAEALPHATALYRAAMAMCRRPALAEDLVQTTLVKALRRFGTFRSGSNCKAWLMRILHNTWVDYLRHRKVVGPTVPVEEQLLAGDDGQDETHWSDPHDLLENFSDEQVIQALAELPDEQRITLFLSDVEDLSQEEIAEITGVAVGTVKSRTSRARGVMREKLHQYAVEMGLAGRREF
ncbi:MAG: sigma-70 family RNA polymerase sigma factor [Phycisphaerae bacterium]